MSKKKASEDQARIDHYYREAINASDALYKLAVEAGASKDRAAGYAHRLHNSLIILRYAAQKVMQ